MRTTTSDDSPFQASVALQDGHTPQASEIVNLLDSDDESEDDDCADSIFSEGEGMIDHVMLSHRFAVSE